MSYSLKSSVVVSCFFTLSFISTPFNPLEAVYDRWSMYNNERGAWGGNGGWWGDSHSDWYGKYGTLEDHYRSSNPSLYPYYSHCRSPCNSYYYSNDYPCPRQRRGNSVDGAALYLNLR